MELLAQEGIQDRSVPVEFTGKTPCGSRLGSISAFGVQDFSFSQDGGDPMDTPEVLVLFSHKSVFTQMKNGLTHFIPGWCFRISLINLCI